MGVKSGNRITQHVKNELVQLVSLSMGVGSYGGLEGFLR